MFTVYYTPGKLSRQENWKSTKYLTRLLDEILTMLLIGQNTYSKKYLLCEWQLLGLKCIVLIWIDCNVLEGNYT